MAPWQKVRVSPNLGRKELRRSDLEMYVDSGNDLGRSIKGGGGVIKPLDWEHLGGDQYHAACPVFGSLKIERYGCDFYVNWSIPGVCVAFIQKGFETLSKAFEAAQEEYERRLYQALSVSC